MKISGINFKPQAPRLVTQQVFARLIQWASREKRTDRYGRKVRLAKAMTQASGKTVTRQMVAMWLHPSERHRTQPTFGFGLLLLAVGTKLMRGK